MIHRFKNWFLNDRHIKIHNFVALICLLMMLFAVNAFSSDIESIAGKSGNIDASLQLQIFFNELKLYTIIVCAFISIVNGLVTYIYISGQKMVKTEMANQIALITQKLDTKSSLLSDANFHTENTVKELKSDIEKIEDECLTKEEHRLICLARERKHS
jgi:hypothetical protein